MRNSAMHLNLSADELLTTTRSVRKRLDFERPVERAVVEECLEIALQAPTGGNRQGWHWVFVEDPAKKQAIADIYAPTSPSTARLPRARRTTRATPAASARTRCSDSATYLAENFHRAPAAADPVHLGPARQLCRRATAAALGVAAAGGVELHARPARAWHGFGVDDDPPDRATASSEVAELLGIPYDQVTQGGLFPIAYTIGTDFKPAKRQPLADVVHWDGW